MILHVERVSLLVVVFTKCSDLPHSHSSQWLIVVCVHLSDI